MTTATDITTDLAAALDPVVMARRAGFEADDWQARVLRSTAPRLILNCSRQAGKSSVSSVVAAHTAVYNPGSLVLLLSPSLRQSQELFKKLATTYHGLGRPVSADSETALTLTLENHSRIVALPGATEKTIRGYSGAALLLLDEASRISDDLYRAVRPMLAVSGGRLILMSTPYGRRGFFFEAWHSAEPWERYEVPATMVPRISPEFLREERESMGDWWYEQEYLCQFKDAEDAVFRTDDVDNAFKDDLEPWTL